jgi:hypothetical protein
MNMKQSIKIQLKKYLPALIVTIGVLLLIYMITVESEPGAIPLLLIVAGIALYFMIRRSS